MRYRYIAYKYMGKIYPDASLQGIWESFGSWAAPMTSVWRPPTDVYETDDELIVILEIGGVREEDLTVTLFSDLLVVEGTRAQPLHSSVRSCHQLGIKYGEFRSEMHIPYPVVHDKVAAEYKNGILTIRLKKSG